MQLALLVATSLMVSHCWLAQAAGAPPGQTLPSAKVLEQIAALKREKASWTPAQRKIGSKLLIHTKKRLGRPVADGVPEMRSSVEIDLAGRTLVDIQAAVTAPLLRRIEELGGRIVNSFPQYHSLRALVSAAQLEALASEAAVQSIRPADELMLHKVNSSQGVVAHAAYPAHTTYGVDGTGVRVGVISDSIEALANLQTSGDLPAGITVLPGQAGAGSSEGTAMLEIVHDIAPGASLYFATAFGGQARFAQNILDLRAAGCNVIVDDVGYFAEPVFQDGIIAQAVQTVSASGAVYLSSAGNSGNLNDGTSGVWEGDFVATAGFGATVNDFGGGMTYNTITGDSPSYFTLQWSDPWGASANDYDLFLLNSTMTQVLASSEGSQDGTQNPFEAISSAGDNDAGCVLVVLQYAGQARYLHLNAHRGRLEIATAGQTSGHSAAAAAFSVAAVNVATAGGGVFTGGAANPMETFSSDGPRRVFFAADGTPITPGNYSSTGGEVRQKPDIAAADGVATATPGFDPFFGTSAAAPHAAGIAALMISRGLTNPTQIRQALTSTAWDIEAAGIDRDSGYGLVNALAAVEHSVVPTVSLSLAGSPMAEAEGPATVTATLSEAAWFPVTVNLVFSGTAMLTSDYTQSSTSISIPAGSLSGAITLAAVQDTLNEADETVVVDIDTVANGTESGAQQVTATIQDDDSPPTVILSLAGSPIVEDGGTATVTATLSAVSGLPVTVNLVFSGTATSTSDYTASETSILIAPGAPSASITLTAVQDTAFEGNETIVVDIDTVVNGTEDGTQRVTVTLTDDDPQIVVTPASRNFGSIPLGTTRDQSFVVQNTGAGTLSGSASVAAPFSVVSGSSYEIAAGQEQEVTVRYSPVSAGVHNETVNFTGGGDDTAAVSGSAYPPPNQAPSFVIGPDLESAQSAEAQTMVAWATGISPGAPEEEAQELDFIVSSDKSYLFGVAPAIDASGTLTYTPALNIRGTATVTVRLHDNGGTALGGQDTSAPQTFEITIGLTADLDEDDLPDDWEAAYALGIESTVNSDSDGDGFTEWDEFLAGTDPTNSGDALRIQAVETAEGDECISLRTVVGKVYRVERNDDFPVGLWVQVGTNVVGTGDVMLILDTEGSTLQQGVYRVSVVE